MQSNGSTWYEERRDSSTAASTVISILHRRWDELTTASLATVNLSTRLEEQRVVAATHVDGRGTGRARTDLF